MKLDIFLNDTVKYRLQTTNSIERKSPVIAPTDFEKYYQPVMLICIINEANKHNLINQEPITGILGTIHKHL